MSDLTTSTVQDTFREACIQTLGAVQRAGRAVTKRVNDPTGQTAAEYMGILLLIAAIFTLNLDDKIGGAVGGAIDGIIKGASGPASDGG